MRAGLAKGSGRGLFAGPHGIRAGGFIALHKGEWEWIGGLDGEDGGGSAYAISLDNWRVVTPVRPGSGWLGQYPAARVNEPVPGTRGNSFALAWGGCGDVVRGRKVACLALHAGAAGVAPGAEITWNYGGLYKRGSGRFAYEVGAGCVPLAAALCEAPASYFGHPSRVPADAYRAV